MSGETVGDFSLGPLVPTQADAMVAFLILQDGGRADMRRHRSPNALRRLGRMIDVGYMNVDGSLTEAGRRAAAELPEDADLTDQEPTP